MKRSIPHWTLTGLNALVAISAAGGAVELVTQGSSRFPASWLQGTPFSDYLVPGLMLGIIVGGSATIAAIATVRRHATGGAMSVVAGSITAGWIAGEVLILKQPHPTWIELGFFCIGLAIVALAAGFEIRPASASA